MIMFDTRFFLLCTPLFVLMPLWIGLARHYRATNRTTLAAIVCATIVAMWAFSLYVRMAINPRLLDAPPWEGINLDGALLGFIGPIAAMMGFVAAGRGARVAVPGPRRAHPRWATRPRGKRGAGSAHSARPPLRSKWAGARRRSRWALPARSGPPEKVAARRCCSRG